MLPAEEQIESGDVPIGGTYADADELTGSPSIGPGNGLQTGTTDGKYVKSMVQYRPATGPAKCGACRYFIAQRKCVLVEGDIDPEDTCNLWQGRSALTEGNVPSGGSWYGLKDFQTPHPTIPHTEAERQASPERSTERVQNHIKSMTNMPDPKPIRPLGFSSGQVHPGLSPSMYSSEGIGTMFSPEELKAARSRLVDQGHLQFAVAHAPAGGVDVQGTRYKGGQFIPGDVMAKATAEEKAEVEEKTEKAQVKEGKPAIDTPKPDVTVKPPKSYKDLPRFLDDVANHPDVKEVIKRFGDLRQEAEASGKTMKNTPYTANHWSMIANTDESGENFTEERQALHRKIVENMLNPNAKAKEGEKPKVYVLMGPPGSGKTTAGAPTADRIGLKISGDDSNVTLINSDDVKAQLPEYEGWNAGAVHEESGIIAEDMVFSEAMEQRHNLVLDITGKGFSKVNDWVDRMGKAGYEIHIAQVQVPDEVAAQRAHERWDRNAFNRDPKAEEPGRYVPADYVAYAVDGKPEQTYLEIKNRPEVQSWIQLDNNVPRGEKPIVLDEGSRNG